MRRCGGWLRVRMRVHVARCMHAGDAAELLLGCAPAPPGLAADLCPRICTPLPLLRAAKAQMLMGRFEAAEELYRQGMQRDASLQQELIACQIGG